MSDYKTVGFDKFLERKTSEDVEMLEDEVSLKTQKSTGESESISKFMRIGLDKDKPGQGERRGAIYYSTDTFEFQVWDGSTWKGVTLS